MKQQKPMDGPGTLWPGASESKGAGTSISRQSDQGEQPENFWEPAGFELPRAVLFVLDRLRESGFEAYVVGGSVRDHLMCRTPSDYDVATSARPAETEAVFRDCRVAETGVKHGTVTVIFEEMSVEVTTYRIDGEYGDGRHPDEVTYTASLEEDLCRRDFTMNAIAYDPKTGFADPFGGRRDIEAGRIACVGSPKKRFGEDSLRILRALRFASTLGFQVEQETAAAVAEMYPSLSRVSRERIYVEMSKLICGQSAKRILSQFPAVIAYAFDPTGVHITPADIFAAAPHLELSACYPEMRYAVIFCHASYKLHELARQYRFDGRTFTYVGDGTYPWEKGTMPHFFHQYSKDGNVSFSTALAAYVYRSLKPSKKSACHVDALLRNRFADTGDPYTLKWLMGKYGGEFPEELIWFRTAMRLMDAAQCSRETAAYRALRDTHPCVTLHQLAVSGKDAVEAGLHGPQIGGAMYALLESVMRGVTENTKEAGLLFFAEYAENPYAYRGRFGGCPGEEELPLPGATADSPTAFVE